MISNIKNELFKQRHIRDIFLLYFIVLSLLFSFVYTSLAVFQKKESINNIAVIKAGSLSVSLTPDYNKYDVKTGLITIPANEEISFTLTVTNNTPTRVKYKLYYQMNKPQTKPEELTIGISDNDDWAIIDKIGSTNNISQKEIVILNDSNEEVTIKIWYDLGYSYNELTLDNNKIALTPNTDSTLTLARIIKENNPVTKTTSDIDFKQIANTDEGLIEGDDADGKTYYFRGAPEDNFLKIEGLDLTFRIIRINGDRTIRIRSITSIGSTEFNKNSDNEKYAGYTYDNSAPNAQDGTDSTIKTFLDNWYQNTIVNGGFDSLFVNSRYCNDTSVSEVISTTIYYSPYYRLGRVRTPSFICPSTEKTYGGEYNLKVGLLSADEYVFTGGKHYETNPDHYLNRNFATWTISPSDFHNNSPYIFDINSSGGLYNNMPNLKLAVMPVLSLKYNTPYKSGSGTKTDPYLVSLN